MATPIRFTYSQWLDKIGSQGSTSQPGLVAAAWAVAAGNGRPRLSAVASVNRWLAEHQPPGIENVNMALHQLETAYHAGADSIDAWLAAQAGEAAPGPAEASAPQLPAAVPEHPWQVVMITLGRVEQKLNLILQMAGIDPAADSIAEQAGLVSEVQQAALAVAQQQGWTTGPAFAEPAAVPDTAEPQPQPAAPDFYGQHVVPPDFAAMAAESDGSEDQ